MFGEAKELRPKAENVILSFAQVFVSHPALLCDPAPFDLRIVCDSNPIAAADFSRSRPPPELNPQIPTPSSRAPYSHNPTPSTRTPPPE